MYCLNSEFWCLTRLAKRLVSIQVAMAPRNPERWVSILEYFELEVNSKLWVWKPFLVNVSVHGVALIALVEHPGVL